MLEARDKVVIDLETQLSREGVPSKARSGLTQAKDECFFEIVMCFEPLRG